MTLSSVVADFETVSPLDLKKVGAWRYSEDPRTEILTLHVDDLVWHPGDYDCDLRAVAEDPNITFIAHNAAFEKAIWRNIMVKRYGFSDIPNARWHDTMAVCAMRVLPQKLERVSAVLRLPDKDAVGSRFTVGLSKPKKGAPRVIGPEDIERVDEYCHQDIVVERALHKRVGWLPAGERRVWLLDQRINERGVRLDTEFVSRAIEVVEKAAAPLVAEFKKITGGIGPNQTKVFTEWLGGAVPNLRKETIAECLGRDIDGGDDEDDFSPGPISGSGISDVVRRTLSIRHIVGSTSIKKLYRMQQVVCEDGRARGLLQYHGAGPGRWAGRLLQPQNFPRGSLKDTVEEKVEAILTGDPDYVDLILGAPIEAVISSLRHSIISNPDRLLCVGDFSTVELRVNLGLAGQMDKIALLASGADPYIDMAQTIYKRPLNKKDNPDERQTGKNSVLGLGFQMGDETFQRRYAPDMPLKIDPEHPEIISCEGVVKIFRKDWAPNIPGNWYQLEAAAIECVHERHVTEAKGVVFQLEDGWLTARLPSGRKLWYFNPKPTTKSMPWDPTDVRRAWTYEALKEGQWRTCDAYGGLLTENVVQALARDLMVAAMFKCEANGMPVVLTVHDEIVTEPLRADADAKALDQIMCDRPDWAKALSIPVAAECWVGDRYRK